MRFRYAPAALLLLAACATTPAAPPVPTTRTVTAPVGQVRDRVEAAIRQLGLTPEPTGNGVQAATRGGASQDWADCRPTLIEYHQDPVPRSAWVDPGAREATVTVSLAPEGSGTRVSVNPEFSATYRDPFRNTPVQRPCASTGALEGRLLAAAGS
jgi:hypothetical protein